MSEGTVGDAGSLQESLHPFVPDRLNDQHAPVAVAEVGHPAWLQHAAKLGEEGGDAGDVLEDVLARHPVGAFVR